MVQDNRYQLPTWAPRLRKSQIEKLYNRCAQGFMDEELIDDVGFSLYARCKSIIDVTEAIRGWLRCPNCDAIIARTREPDEILECTACNWKCPWKSYQKIYQLKNLNAGGLEVFIREYVRKFENTHSHPDRLVLIDTLIHRFHWEQRGSTEGRPGACNLIEGKMKNIMAFLDRLDYDENVPRGMYQTRNEWRRIWADNSWSKGKGQ